MSIRFGFNQLKLERFDGLCTTLAPQDLPPNLSAVCNNAAFTKGGVGSRGGTTTYRALGAGTDIYHSEFLLFGNNRYYFFLMSDHKLYYCTDTTAARVLLHSPSASPTMFKLCPYGNFIYIFYSGGNGTFGTSGPFVWDPSKLPTIQVDLCTILPEPNITTFATAVGTGTGNFSDGETVTVHLDYFGEFRDVEFIYTFVTALSSSTAPAMKGTDGEVLLGATLAISLANLKSAINLDPSGLGTLYGVATADPYVLFYASAVTSTTITLTARQSGATQNGIEVTETCANFSWGAMTFTGGAKLDGTDGIGGDVDNGYHAVRVIFVTRTGYYSSPSTYRVCLVRGNGSTLPMSGLPTYSAVTGHLAAECVARILIMTEAFGSADELESALDRQNWTNAVGGSYYTALTISDNSTTTGTINISDAQLINQTNWDAAFLYISPLPFFSIGKTYHERMVACGDSANSTLAYISEVGFPQTFRSDTGFNDIIHDDGVALVSLFQIRDVLYFVKGIGIYATQDTGAAPYTWQLMTVSSQVGTASLSGVSEMSDEEFAVILDFKGAYFFNGSPPEDLSKDIQPTWATISVPYMATAEVHIDSVKKRIFFLVPTGSDTRPTKAFMLDYQEGWQRKKWSIWYPQTRAWRSMMMDTGGYRALVCLDSPNIQQFDDAAITDNGIAIDYENRTGLIDPQSSGLVLFGGTDLHVVGSGALSVKHYGPDMTLLETDTIAALSSAPGQDQFIRKNIRTERIFLGVSSNDVAAASELSRLVVFSKPDGDRAY